MRETEKERDRGRRNFGVLWSYRCFSHHCLYWAIKSSEEKGQGGTVPPWRDNTRV